MHSWHLHIQEVGLQALTARTITPGEEDCAIATVILAFAADPVARWTWPHSREYLAGMPKLVRAFGGNGFKHGGAYGTEECTGVALWLPPGVHPDEEQLNEVVQ